MHSSASADPAHDELPGSHGADGTETPTSTPSELESLLPLVTHASASSIEDDSSFTESSSRQPESGPSTAAADRQVWRRLCPLILCVSFSGYNCLHCCITSHFTCMSLQDHTDDQGSQESPHNRNRHEGGTILQKLISMALHEPLLTATIAGVLLGVLFGSLIRLSRPSSKAVDLIGKHSSACLMGVQL